MISQLTSHAEHSDLVLTWLRSTWDDPNDVFPGTLAPTRNCPGALLAISDGVPTGALTFRRHRTTWQVTNELWINTVYVVPGQRGLGTGRKLIRSAVEHSIPQYTERLFVFTDVPTLYEPLGWKQIDYNAECSSFTLGIERNAVV
ncbi:GNAT family N-acetyltransferase [Novipirellula rosea]|uniref:GNAT family N-acetyltransferase n=1 Tax=Novipirellula rosea TaxID=1031540 RepID=UPI003CD0A4B3